MENELKQKKNTGLYAIIGILCVMVLALGGYTVYKEFIEKDKEEKECSCTKCDVKDTTTTDDNTKTDTTDTTNCISSIIPDTSKIIGGSSENVKYTLSNPYSNYNAFSAYVESDGKTVYLTIAWHNIKDSFNITTDTSYKEYKIAFTKKINNIYLMGYGQDMSHDSLFALMEDGTVEYVPIVPVISKNRSIDITFENKGAIAGVKDVAYITQGTSEQINCDICFGGGAEVLAIKKDGSIYVLSNMIDK